MKARRFVAFTVMAAGTAPAVVLLLWQTRARGRAPAEPASADVRPGGSFDEDARTSMAPRSPPLGGTIA